MSMYDEDFMVEEEDDELEDREDLWDEMFDDYFYEDPMEKAMHEVGMSWSDFI